MAAAQGEAAFKTSTNKVNDFDARSADDTHQTFINTCEEEKENEVHNGGEKSGSGGLTDLEKAYRDVLNAPLSPTSFGGRMSVIRAFKH